MEALPPGRLVKETSCRQQDEQLRRDRSAQEKRRNSLATTAQDSPVRSATPPLPLPHRLCGRCKQEIVLHKKERRITSDDGLSFWHEACFVCQLCSQPLIDIGYFENGDKIYCDNCMDEHICRITCSTCQQLIRVYSKDEEILLNYEPMAVPQFNPLTHMFLRRTFSDNTTRRTPRYNSVSTSSASPSVLKKKKPPTQGLHHYFSFGHELSNIVRLGGSPFGQSAPCLLIASSSSHVLDDDQTANQEREFLSPSSSGTHQGRLRSSYPTRRSSHHYGGGRALANDSTATSPTDSPKIFGQNGQLSRFYSNGHRRWSVASFPGGGSSGYATEPSDGTASIYTSNEGLPASPNPLTASNAAFRFHAKPVGAPPASLSLNVTTDRGGSTLNNNSSLISPRATSAFSSSDSNPVFEIPMGPVGQPELVSPMHHQRSWLTRKHSTPSICSLGDDDIAILNSVYQECFPRAQKIMEDRLRSLIATEQANPIALPESMDGAFCFVHDQALQLAADCLRASELNQLSATQFSNLSSNLGQLAKQAKEKCPLSAQKLHRVIINILMAIARCARLCECLEFSPDSFKLGNQLESPGQGIISQVQADVYHYVTEQLGDLVTAGLSGLDDVPLFNRNAKTPPPQVSSSISTVSQQQREQKTSSTSSLGSITAPSEDDFEVVKNISNGAYGSVFLVRQKRTGQRFAMKRISKRCMALHNRCEQIWAERNILTFADNPFVVHMYCSFETPHHYCMVMEYVQGGDVASLLKKVRTIPVDLARVYFAELVLALAYLHSYGIIHRDIKPENLLITSTGHIKLTDFGLSKIGLMNRTTNLYETEQGPGGVSSNNERLFKDKQVYGTPQYIAPEVILGQDYGKAVDWWSVGVVLYECLLGITPFYGQAPQEVFHMIVYHDAIEWPDDPDDPLYPTDDSKSFVESLLLKDPELRLGSGSGDASEVKAHAFFDSVDWTAVLWQKAEMLFVPQLDDEDDTGYFDSRTDRYTHDDTAVTTDEAMLQADLVFPPAGHVLKQERAVTDNEQQSTATLDAPLHPIAVTSPMSDLLAHSFCSFSPRYARDSLSLISSSGESSPRSLSGSAADLNSSRRSRINRRNGESSPEEEPSCQNSRSGSTSNSRAVPLISVHATAATPPSKPDDGNILSVAAAQVAAAEKQRVPRPISSNNLENKPLLISVSSSNQPQQAQQTPLSGGIDDHHGRTSLGSETSSSSLSPLSPCGFPVPAPITIKRGPHGFGFTFRTVRIREPPAETAGPGAAGKPPTPQIKSRLQHQILAVQGGSPAAAAGLQPGHVILAINEGCVDGRSHIEIVTRLSGSKNEVVLYTCEPEVANSIRHNASVREVCSNKAPVPPCRKLDPVSKTRTSLCRHSSMSDHAAISQPTTEATSPGQSVTNESQIPPPVKPRSNAVPRSHAKLTATTSGSISPRMQRAYSPTVLQAMPAMGQQPQTSNATPNRPQQLLPLPGGSNGGRQLGPHRPQQSQPPQQSLLHPCPKLDGGDMSPVSRRRSFHTMPSPLARTPSPLPVTSVNTSNATSPITPLSPQRMTCSPLVQQELGGLLRMRVISTRRGQSVYVPNFAFSSPQSNKDNLCISGSSSTTSLPVEFCDDHRNGQLLDVEVVGRKSESAVATPTAEAAAQLLVKRRLTTEGDNS